MPQTILIIPDMHIPYEHPDTLAFLKAVKKSNRITNVICLGDEVDNHAISFHDSDPDLDSAGQELEKARQRLAPFFKLFPKVTVLESNHGSLVYRRAAADGYSRQFFKSYREILGAPRGWVWVFDYTMRTPLGKVYFHHSKGANALKNSQAMGMSFVQGHHHEQMCINYWANPEKLMFGATVGSLVDRRSLAFAYAKNNLKKQLIGCMIIEDGIPRLIPMLLNSAGRWKGKL